MKLYARRGFEWAEDGLVGLWSPVSTGGTQGMLLDCNPSTNNHGTLTGYTDINTGWVGSDYGTSKNYNGSTDRDLCSTNPLLGATNFAISVWARRTAAQRGQLVANQYLSGGEFTGFRFFYENTATFGTQPASFTFQCSQFVVANNSWSTPANSFPQNVWKHCVMNFITGLQVEFFIDGRRVTTSNWGGSTNTNEIRWGTVDRGLGFGRTSQSYLNSDFFAGQIAEIKTYYNRTLSAGEAMQDFQAGPGGMWQDRPRRSRVYFGAAGFKAYWARRQFQLIGGGV